MDQSDLLELRGSLSHQLVPLLEQPPESWLVLLLVASGGVVLLLLGVWVFLEVLVSAEIVILLLLGFGDDGEVVFVGWLLLDLGFIGRPHIHQEVLNSCQFLSVLLRTEIDQFIKELTLVLHLLTIHFSLLFVIVEIVPEILLIKFLHNGLQILLNIVADVGHLIHILTKVVMLNICNLGMFAAFFLQVAQVVVPHLLDEGE